MPCSIQIRGSGVGLSQGETVRGFGMGEVGRVEVHAETVGLGPIDPAPEMPRLDSVRSTNCRRCLSIACMQVKPVLAGDQRRGLFKVRSQLPGVAGFARIISRHCQTAPQFLRRNFQNRPHRRPASNAGKSELCGGAASRASHPHPGRRSVRSPNQSCVRYLYCASWGSDRQQLNEGTSPNKQEYEAAAIRRHPLASPCRQRLSLQRKRQAAEIYENLHFDGETTLIEKGNSEPKLPRHVVNFGNGGRNEETFCIFVEHWSRNPPLVPAGCQL